MYVMSIEYRAFSDNPPKKTTKKTPEKREESKEIKTPSESFNNFLNEIKGKKLEHRINHWNRVALMAKGDRIGKYQFPDSSDNIFSYEKPSEKAEPYTELYYNKKNNIFVLENKTFNSKEMAWKVNQEKYKPGDVGKVLKEYGFYKTLDECKKRQRFLEEDLASIDKETKVAEDQERVSQIEREWFDEAYGLA